MVLLLSGVMVLVGPAQPAAAHAVLVTADPAPGSVLGGSPRQVVLTFSEPVRPVTGRLQVLAPDGKRITDGAPRSDGNTVVIPIRIPDRPLGTYLVSYRIISADSHPVGSGYTFSVGAPSATVPQVDSDGQHPSVTAAVLATKYVGYVGVVLALGPAMLLALLWPTRVSRRPGELMVRSGLLLIGVAAAAGLWVQAPYSTGSRLWEVSFADLRAVLTSGYGLALLARLVILAAVAAAVAPLLAGAGGKRRGLTLIALALGGLGTWPLTGHAMAAPVPAVSIVADTVHIAAMGVWIGGLLLLGTVLLRRAHPRVLGRILPAWSRWAAVSVCWLVLAGIVQALMETGTVAALLTTTYGRLVLLKVALVLMLLVAAGYARRLVNRWSTVRTRQLAGTVAVEVALAVVALGVSAVLVQTTPARTAAVEAQALGQDSFAQTLTNSLYTLQFDIYPVQLGEYNTVHAYVYTPEGAPVRVEEWSMTTALPTQDVEPVTAPLLPIDDNHAAGSVAFPVPGEWEVRFTIRLSDIDQATVTTTVAVR
ncbi:copper resistance CopC/CopD family protein [Micromonospora sp. NBC_01813]|uniref:copper resistance CopC/CopD family protein n=1 Tax=Micromonospora sp. NBC_01813 TaxID=2975988 RepID=UPI002DD7E61D|nr:copper resistance protein CopC [Micromonospora sp. NBC_01813]WSA10445.1 copper resistance protein CopC/CopD [Micromonospora sp. NBC_01813]